MYRIRIYYHLVQFSGMLHCWLQRYHARIKTLGSSLVFLYIEFINNVPHNTLFQNCKDGFALRIKMTTRAKIDKSLYHWPKGALAWYGKLTWESAHAWILKILCYLIIWGYNFNIYGAFEFLCNSIANL